MSEEKEEKGDSTTVRDPSGDDQPGNASEESVTPRRMSQSREELAERVREANYLSVKWPR
ncbi:hypothetical protein HOK021_01170 [Streptomyces hygroscopicus]|nr:hypothetical protein HOK021_01170 [Streptomyces hygroscopicus]